MWHELELKYYRELMHFVNDLRRWGKLCEGREYNENDTSAEISNHSNEISVDNSDVRSKDNSHLLSSSLSLPIIHNVSDTVAGYGKRMDRIGRFKDIQYYRTQCKNIA